MSERYDLTVPREYEANGETKTAWDPVGVMFRRTDRDGNDRGGFSLRFNHMPGVTIMAFPHEDKDRERKPQQADRAAPPPDDDDIPW